MKLSGYNYHICIELTVQLIRDKIVLEDFVLTTDIGGLFHVPIIAGKISICNNQPWWLAG